MSELAIQVFMQLILKGSNQTFYSLSTTHKIEEYSFTLLEATYRESTNLTIEKSDYLSFDNLITLLQNAGDL